MTLIEASPFLGGRAMALGSLYPTDEPAAPLVQRLIDEVRADERIDDPHRHPADRPDRLPG